MLFCCLPKYWKIVSGYSLATEEPIVFVLLLDTPKPADVVSRRRSGTERQEPSEIRN